MAGLEAGSSRDKVLSLQDVIDEDVEMEKMANAVLGASDDKKCTYSKVTTQWTQISAHLYIWILHSFTFTGIRESTSAVRVRIV